MAEFKNIETQEQLDAVVGDRVARAKDSIRKEFEGWISPEDFKKRTADLNGDLNKQIETLTSQIQTMKEAAAETEKKLAESANYRADLEKTRIAIAAGLKLEYADRLRGDTAEEWEADAKALAKDFAASHSVAPLGNSESANSKSSTRDKFADWANDNFFQGGN